MTAKSSRVMDVFQILVNDWQKRKALKYVVKPSERGVRDLLPTNGKRGGQWHHHRATLNGIFWILHTGAQWREMPERYGKWQSIYDRFVRWRRDGTLDAILRRLQMRLDKDGRIDWDLWCIDGTNVRASRSAAGGGRKTKISRTNRRITRWAAAAAGGAASSTWSLTAKELRWWSKPVRARRIGLLVKAKEAEKGSGG